MYCPKCGKEISEEAYVCIGCGCVVGQPRYKQEKIVEDLDLNSKIKTFASIALWVFYACLAFAILFFCTGVSDLYVSSYADATWFYSEYAVGLLISSIFAYIVSILALILGIKSKDYSIRNSCVICFVIANAVLFSAMIIAANSW